MAIRAGYHVTWKGTAFAGRMRQAADDSAEDAQMVGMETADRLVHVITGELKGSLFVRRVRGGSQFGFTSMHGVYEIARSGSHDFWNPAIEAASRAYPVSLQQRVAGMKL